MAYGLRHGVFDFKREIISTTPATYPTDGLLARWTFDSSLSNSLGSYFHLVPAATPYGFTYDTGKLNQAWKSNKTSWNDSSPYSRFQNTADASIYNACNAADFTVAGWFSITNTSADIEYMFSFYSGGTLRFGLYSSGVSSTPSGKTRGCLVCSLGTIVSDYDYRQNSTWHHFACGYGSSKSFLYVDNSFIGESSQTRPGAATIFQTSANGSWIMNGLLDQFYLYNKRLSSDEVAQLWNSGSGI